MDGLQQACQRSHARKRLRGRPPRARFRAGCTARLHLRTSEPRHPGGSREQESVACGQSGSRPRAIKEALAEPSPMSPETKLSWVGPSRPRPGNFWRPSSSRSTMKPAAEDAFQHLLALEPDDVEARRDLARILEHRHDLEWGSSAMGTESSVSTPRTHRPMHTPHCCSVKPAARNMRQRNWRWRKSSIRDMRTTP